MISLYDLLDAGNGQLFGEPRAQLFSNFCFEAHRAKENDLFIGLKTDGGDTHTHMAEAVMRGATGLLCTRPPDFDTSEVSVILVKDSVIALRSWAQHILTKYGTTVVGVGASSGARTVVNAIGHLLTGHTSVLTSTMTDTDAALPASETADALAVPIALAGLKPEHRIAVLELRARRPGDMAALVKLVTPQIGVISRLGDARTDIFETPEQFSAEYGQLINALTPAGLAVLNYDDEQTWELARQCRAPLTTVGIDSFSADLLAYNVVLSATRTGFDVRYAGQRFVGRWTPLLGRQALVAGLCALAVGAYFEVPLADALKSLTDIQPLPGMMHPFNAANGALIVDDSADADPQATLDALDWLQAVCDSGQRAIFVMGDMDHLGAHSQRGHRHVGQRAAAFVDTLIVEGTEAAAAGRAALDHGMERKNVHITYSAQDTIALLKAAITLTDNDIVLIKGGASARMEWVTRALLTDEGDKRRLPRAGRLTDAAQLMRSNRPAWVEINLDAIAGNVRAVKRIVGENVTLFAVIKADAYGHGAVAVARTALLNGAGYLAVANVQEAVDLRDTGIEAPILVMGYTPEHALRQAIRQQITITLYDIDLARAFDRAAQDIGGTLRAHVKVDTGMGRLGVPAGDAVNFFRYLLGMKNIEVEGIYTHFATADEDASYVQEQLRAFRGVLTPLRAAGYSFKYIHAANSAAALAHPDAHFNAVRVGLALYGLAPSDIVPLPAGFEAAMTWKTSIASVKTLPPGHPIGYGNSYYTTGYERVAVIPVGYADGFRRAPHATPCVLVKGEVAPVVGRISMEKTVIRVDHLPDVSIGDEVVLMGRQGAVCITAEDIAARWGTINYEVVCAALARIPRR
jgi:alanine racemase